MIRELDAVHIKFAAPQEHLHKRFCHIYDVLIAFWRYHDWSSG